MTPQPSFVWICLKLKAGDELDKKQTFDSFNLLECSECEDQVTLMIQVYSLYLFHLHMAQFWSMDLKYHNIQNAHVYIMNIVKF